MAYLNNAVHVEHGLRVFQKWKVVSPCPVTPVVLPRPMDELQHLISDLRSSDAATREVAAQALHDFGAEAKPAVQSLFDAILQEPDACPWVGAALTQLGPLAPDMKSLALALQSKNPHVRFWAARTAVKLGPEAEPLIPDLIALLCDPNHSVIDSVVWALGAIGRSAITPLIAASRCNDPELRARAVLALGRYPEHAEKKLPAIVESLDDSIANVRNHAARAICSLGQSTRPDPCVYDADTCAMLITGLNRIVATRRLMLIANGWGAFVDGYV